MKKPDSETTSTLDVLSPSPIVRNLNRFDKETIRIDLKGNSIYLPSTLANFCSCRNKALAFNYYCVCLRLVLINFQECFQVAFCGNEKSKNVVAVSSPNVLTKINQLPGKLRHTFETAHRTYQVIVIFRKQIQFEDKFLPLSLTVQLRSDTTETTAVCLSIGFSFSCTNPYEGKKESDAS
uniref:Uncharacterized protein n=1 Tax=Glossina pallidipes TaxID=7398 RepID=A0A1A9Z257_GLOPL